MLNRLKNSNIKLSIDLNPFVWRFHINHEKPTRESPKLTMTYIQLLFFGIWIVSDDGTFIPWEETIIPAQGTGGDSL